MAEIIDLIGRRNQISDKKAEEDAETFLKIQEMMLKILDGTRKLVEEGKLDGLVILGRDPASRAFMNQIVLAEPFVERQGLFAYAGFLDGIKLEILDYAAHAPYMELDGVLNDPFDEPEEFE